MIQAPTRSRKTLLKRALLCRRLISSLSRALSPKTTHRSTAFSSTRSGAFSRPPLYSTWGGLAPGRSFIAASDVGIFRTPGEPPLVPDVFLSLDVNLLIDSRFAEGRSYCMWYYRKPPDVAIEIVSSDKGDEIHVMFDNYARFGVRCLVIFNPTRRAQEGMLRAYELAPSATYVESAPDPLPDTGLGLKLWDGEFEKMNATWLRWHVASGPPILTGEERASRAKERTERAMERTRQANEQVARLAPLLRKHGISLDNNDDQS